MEVRSQSFRQGAIVLSRYWFLWCISFYPRSHSFLPTSSVPSDRAWYFNGRSAFRIYASVCEKHNALRNS